MTGQYHKNIGFHSKFSLGNANIPHRTFETWTIKWWNIFAIFLKRCKMQTPQYLFHIPCQYWARYSKHDKYWHNVALVIFRLNMRAVMH